MQTIIMTALTTILSFAVHSTAQASDNWMEITFSPPTNDCSIKNSNTTTTDSLKFTLTQPPKFRTCFDLNSTFSNPNTTYSQAGYTCPSNRTACGAHYTLVGASNHNANNPANYSQIMYRQSDGATRFNATGRPGATDIGLLTFQTYNGKGCLQAENEENELQPWDQWTCVEREGSCSVLPYHVRSFAILSTSQNSANMEKCETRQSYGGVHNAAGRTMGGLNWMLAGFLSTAWLFASVFS